MVITFWAIAWMAYCAKWGDAEPGRYVPLRIASGPRLKQVKAPVSCTGCDQKLSPYRNVQNVSSSFQPVRKKIVPQPGKSLVLAKADRVLAVFVLLSGA